jgi:hypothetical protein
MATNVEDTIDMEWIRTVMDRHNPHVESTTDTVADFRFKRPEWAICATTYSSAYIPLDADRYIRFQEPSFLGISNMAPFTLTEREEPSTFRRPPLGYMPDTFDRVFSPSPMGVVQLRESFPDFFERDKQLVLLPGENQSAEGVEDIIQQINDQGYEPQDYVFLPVMHGGSQPVGESFYEYMVALHFIEEGFVPTTYGARNVRGVPDLFVYRVPEIATTYGGRFALEFLLAPDREGISTDNTTSRSFAIEAEPTSQRTRSKGDSGVGQIQGQGYHRPFSGGISTGPSDRSYAEGRIGMVVFGSDAEKAVADPESLGETADKAMYGFKEYLKFILLQSRYGDLQESADTYSAYIDRVSEIDLAEILD